MHCHKHPREVKKLLQYHLALQSAGVYELQKHRTSSNPITNLLSMTKGISHADLL